VRNLHEMSQQAREIAQAPRHPRKPIKVYNSHEQLMDSYDYFRAGITKEEEDTFCEKEQTFQQLMLLKYDYLTKALWRELEYYKLSPRGLPVVLDDYIYYRRIDNAADSLTLYRFPVDELKQWHQEGVDLSSPSAINELTGEIPNYPKDPDQNPDLSYSER